MTAGRVAAIAWCLAGVSEPVASPAEAPSLLAPPPCTTSTDGPGLELLASGMRDLGIEGTSLRRKARRRELGSGSALFGSWPDLVVWLLGAELPGQPTMPRPVVDAALRARGAELYSRHCAICHGTRGDGKGPLAAMLADAPPQDFTTGVYKLRTTPHGSLPSDEDLFRTISRGIHGTAMLPWTNLSEPDRWALVAQLEAFSSDFADAPPREPIVIGIPPPPTAALRSRGRRLFQTAGCASCHGTAGRGDGPAAALLRDPVGRPIRPTDLTGYGYRRGARTEEIYMTLRTGFDGTPMGSFASTLSSRDSWAIAAYVHAIAPRYVETANGVACPQRAAVDAWEEEGVRMAAMTLLPARAAAPQLAEAARRTVLARHAP